MFNLNKFKTKTTKAFTPYSFETAQEVLDFFNRYDVRQLKAKEKANLLVFGKLDNPENGRVKENLASTTFVVLDIDKTSEAEVEKIIEKMTPFHYILHETFTSAEEEPKIRLIVLLDRSISAEKYAKFKLSSRMAGWVGINEIDKVSDNPVQPYYEPSAPLGIEREILVNQGKGCLPLKMLLGVEPKGIKATKRSKSDQDEESDDGVNAEIAEADRLINEVFGGNLMFVNNRFWRYANGIWTSSNKRQMLKELVKDVYQSRKKIGEVEEVMEILEIITYQSEFPTCKRKNGVMVLETCAVDPLTRKKLKHSPRHYARNRLQFDYDAQAECCLWLQFLDQVFRDDDDKAEKIALLQEYMGLSMTTIFEFQKMLWMIGRGANGKGVIFEIARALIGNENCSSLPLEHFKRRFALEQLENKLANFDPEMSATAVLADAEIKSVVGGDVMSLERKREPVFQARLVAKLWVAANCLPVIKDHSHGFFRRVLILTFNRVFTDAEQNKGLAKELKQELPGVFNWALAGLHRLLENQEFTIPASSLAEVDEYKVNSNPVEKFLREHLTVVNIKGQPSQGTLAKTVFEAYKTFAGANGFSTLSSSTFGIRLKALDVDRGGGNGKRYYAVKLKDMDIYENSGFGSRFTAERRCQDVDDAFEIKA